MCNILPPVLYTGPRPKELRDEFAMVALTGIMATGGSHYEAAYNSSIAYRHADVMMREREKAAPK